jgi:hypothetical protein
MSTLRNIQKLIDDFNQTELGKLSDSKVNKIDASIRGGKTVWKNLIETGKISEMGKVSATKQWEENREIQLEKCSKGGKKCLEEKKGIFTLSEEQLSDAGKKGYDEGLGKLSKEERSKILDKANKKRLENRKFSKEDIKYIRENFKPYDIKFGVVPLSKKFEVHQCTIRSIIKNKSYTDY